MRNEHCLQSLLSPTLFGLLFLLVINGTAQAQLRNLVDHRGKEFRLAFLPTNGEAEFPTYYIAVSCEKATTGTITYEATGKRMNISIPNSNQIVRISLDSSSLLIPNPLQGEGISKQTLTVRFNDEVTLYGMNTMRWSSDAFLGLPLDAIGREYVVMSYPNTVEPSAAGQVLNVADFPSQFAIVGTENNTTVMITPSTSINGRGNTQPFSIQLKAGEVFYAEAQDEKNKPLTAGGDLTGTQIKADNPVVVMGSQQRTNIPWNTASGRDHLVEQLLSVDRWPRQVMVTPHYQIKKTANDSNFVRIIAAQSETILTVDDISSQPLPIGTVAEIPLDRAKLLTANKPILVAQFQHSAISLPILVENDSVGDPFMMLVSSREQFDSTYTFESWNTNDFYYHYINVVIPTERISSLVLDGYPVNAKFLPVYGTSYSYAQIPVTAGGHYIHARAPFGLYIYGYGPYNSYGAPGGMVFDSLFKDQKEPTVRIEDACGGAAGTAFDSAQFDFGIEELRLESTSNNVNLVSTPVAEIADSVSFHLDLIDPYQDGWAELIAVDSAGLRLISRVPVKGFTISLASGPNQIRLDTLTSLNGLDFCTEITLTNYGAFPHQINEFTFSKSVQNVQIDQAYPITLQPGETRLVKLCFQRTANTSDFVEISLSDGCLQRTIAGAPLREGSDSLNMSLGVEESQAKGAFTITPNPARNRLRVTYGLFGTGKGKAVRLYDLLGRDVVGGAIPFASSGSLELDISALPEGVYQAVLEGREGKIIAVQSVMIVR